MLTCEICGEELLLEDMRTHFLLKHLENDMYFPLCSLFGIIFDDLCFHIREKCCGSIFRLPGIS